MKTKEELKAMGLPSTSEIDVESVRNIVRTLNEANKEIASLQSALAAANALAESRETEIEKRDETIERMRTALEKLAETQHVANFHNVTDWRKCHAVTCQIALQAILK